MVKVDIYDHGDWSAVYIDGQLARWHDTPDAAEMASLLGCEVNRDDMPRVFVGGPGKWSPPPTLDEFRRVMAEAERERIEEDIRTTERRLKLLRSMRKGNEGNSDG